MLLFWTGFVFLLVATQTLFRVREVKSYLLLALSLPFTWSFVWLVERRSFHDIGLRRIGAFKALSVGALAAVGVHASMCLIFAFSGFLTIHGISSAARSGGVMALLYGSPVTSVAGTLATAISEEILFTGYTMGTATRGYGPKAGMFAWATAVFLTHLGNPSGGLSFLPVSLCAAYLWFSLYASTGSLWTTIGFHWMHNFILGGLLALPVSGYVTRGLLATTLEGPIWLTGGSAGPEGGLVVPSLMVVCGFAFSKAARAKRPGHTVPCDPAST